MASSSKQNQSKFIIFLDMKAFRGLGRTCTDDGDLLANGHTSFEHVDVAHTLGMVGKAWCGRCAWQHSSGEDDIVEFSLNEILLGHSLVEDNLHMHVEASIHSTEMVRLRDSFLFPVPIKTEIEIEKEKEKEKEKAKEKEKGKSAV